MIKQEIDTINQILQKTNARLIAVSKYYPVEDVKTAYDCGQRLFGESREQELRLKQMALPKDIEWHFIGHLQTNKVKYIVPYISLIHSVDSVKLLEEINKQGEKINRKINVLLQVYIAKEENKYGFDEKDLLQYFSTEAYKSLDYINFCGIMGMATNTDDKEEIRREFRQLRKTFEIVKSSFFKDNHSFCELSMGMSEDFQIAIEEGATLIRIGSRIFQ